MLRPVNRRRSSANEESKIGTANNPIAGATESSPGPLEKHTAASPPNISPTNMLPVSPSPGSLLMEQQDTAEANRQAILNSPSYRLAEYDFDFLKRDDIRHVRMTLELLT